MKLTKGLRVGVRVIEHDEGGKLKPTPPKFFGEVTRAADDGESGYVQIDGEDDEIAFHADELEPETKAAAKPKGK